MKYTTAAALAGMLLAAPVFADGHASGDAAAGENVFKKCKSCHMIVSDDGETIFKGGKTGPNLYGIVGRAAGSVDGYKYGKSIVEAGEKGLVWDEASFVGYVQDPKGYLGEYLDDSKARSKMSYKLKKGMEDVWAYLASVGPQS